MMPSLRWRLTLSIVLITLTASLVVGIGLGRFTEREFQQFLEIETEMSLVEFPDPASIVDRLRAADTDGARTAIESLAAQAGRRMLVFAADGALLLDSNPAGDSVEYLDGDLEVVRVGEDANGLFSERLRLSGGETLGDPDEALGVLFVLPGVELAQEGPPEIGFMRRIGRAHLLGVAVATLLALVLALVLSGRILGPIETLTGAARRLAGGDLSQRVDVRTRDEIGELSRAFNAMATSLEQQEVTRRNMVSDIAHELRTPLTHLRCKLESVQDGLLPTDDALIGELHGEIVHLGRLVDDLQELALAEAGQLPLYPSDVDLAAVSRQIVASPPEAAGTPTVTLESDAGLPLGHVDVDRFRQVLRNSLENALRHGRQNGRVIVRATRRDDAIHFSIEDDGPGIPAEHQARIFDRFYRTDPSRDRATGGAGLGLAISRQLVLAWGGSIGIDSEPGHGATLWFTVPLR